MNCTSIDWFLDWPTEALKAVSDHHLLLLHGVIREATEIINPFAAKMHEERKAEEPTAAKPRGLETIAEGYEDAENASAAGRRETGRMHGESVISTGPKDTPLADVSGGNLSCEEDPEALIIAKMSIRERVG